MDGRDDAVRQLRAAGLRVTIPRLGVLTELADRPHADVETLAGAVRARQGPVSTQAIYDVLGALVERGVVRRIQPAGSPARYELRVGDNHHHLVCRECGTIADVDCAVGAKPCLTAGDPLGFVVEEADVIYWGYCPRCQQRADHAAAPRR